MRLRESRTVAAALLALAFSPALIAQDAPGPASPTPEVPALEAPAVPGSERAGRATHEEAATIIEETRARVDATLRALGEVEYRHERAWRLESYGADIEENRVRERALREAAIADFERFLERYPDHRKYTPDVIFRLAELHYERALDAFNQADAAYQLALDQADEDPSFQVPPEPRKDFTTTIALFERLIEDFPDYRQVDGASYLLAVCLDQMGRWDEAMAQFQSLVATYPESDFAQESWLRIGEYHFEVAAFEAARDAYLEALEYGESVWFDKVLFKLGWSYYLLSEYHDGIAAFDQLLQHYEATENAAASLEEEALQYFAISVAEEDWDLDGERDPDFVMPRVYNYLGGEGEYVGRVLSRLTEILMERQQYEGVIEVNVYANSRYACAEGNLDRALQSVEALTQLRRFEEAIALQRDIGTDFGPGTAWNTCMQEAGNTEALARAEAVVRDSLIESAALYYNQAQATRNRALESDDELLLVQSESEFSFAADIYGDFLASYADDESAYEMRLYYGQALLLATRYAEAAEQFGLVRDDERSEEHRELAAALAIQSYEFALEQEIDAYRLEGRAWPAYDGENAWVSEQVSDFDPTEARELETDGDPIPELSLAWATAIDRYLALGLNSEDDPRTAFRYGFQVGKLYYDYGHYGPAEERFQIVLDRCDPSAPESGFAAGFLLNSYQARGDTAAVASFEEALSGRYERCIAPDTLAELRRDVGRIGGGILARSAEELFAAGDYAGAAAEYARLAEEFSDDAEFAPIGLFNSGLIYEQQLRRFEDAIAQFDLLIARYPDSEFADDAHVRIAVNAKRFFDFDRAIREFVYLDEIGFSDPELVEHPLLDAAQLMESVGRSRDAATAYLDWAGRFPSDPRAAAAVYSAGVLYDELGDHTAMRRVFERFRSEYGNGFGEAIDIDAAVIDTFYRSGLAYERAGDLRSARVEFDELLSEYALRLPQAVRARYAAAKVVFDRAMRSFEAWNAITLGESVEAQQLGLQRRIEGIEPVALEFRVVPEYGSAEWTACAFYMEGRIFQVMADLLYGLPLPDFGGDIDAEDAYLNMVESFASQYEDQAIASWEVAYPLMRELGVNNRCTVDMTAQLNQYRGARYPVFRTAIEHEADSIASPPGLRAPPEPEAAPSPLPAETEVGTEATDAPAEPLAPEASETLTPEVGEPAPGNVGEEASPW